MEELIKSILEDGKIDPEEVQQLRDCIFADQKVDKEEAEALFRLNNEAKEKCPEFQELFVEAIKSYILADGEIDKEETEFLKEQISADGEIDENEQALLSALAAEVELPEVLADMLD